MSPFALIVTAIAAITAPQLTQTDDSSLIGYFEGPCPEGWGTYQNLSGTVDMGSYYGYNHSKFGEICAGDSFTYYINTHKNSEGASQLPNNMSHYLFLTACQKTKFDKNTNQNYFLKLQREITAIKNHLNETAKQTLVPPLTDSPTLKEVVSSILFDNTFCLAQAIFIAVAGTSIGCFLGFCIGSEVAYEEQQQQRRARNLRSAVHAG